MSACFNRVPRRKTSDNMTFAQELGDVFLSF